MFKKFSFIAFTVLSFSVSLPLTSTSFASDLETHLNSGDSNCDRCNSTDQTDGSSRDNRKCKECKVPKKTVCFNVYCQFEDKKDSDDDREDADSLRDFHECTAAATFKKEVTVDGGEVVDDSNFENNPELNVVCRGNKIFNSSANRYTDLLGTRIQGESGPFPALLLPRGALSSGADNRSGDHVTFGSLELTLKKGLVHKKGKCFIWTKAP